MPSKPQTFGFLACLAISLYLLVFGIPSRLPLPQLLSPQPKEAPVDDVQVLLLPFSPESETAQPSDGNSLPLDPEMAARTEMNVHDEFSRRFGHSYQDAFEPRQAVHYDFNAPEGIRDMVHFWVQVFGKFGKLQYIFHDKDNLSYVYSVLDLSDLDPAVTGMDAVEFERLKKQAFDGEKDRIQRQLRALHDKLGRNLPLDANEKRLADAFARSPRDAMLKAADADQIRIQSGFSHRFKEAIYLSGQYMEEMENIFSMKGVPVEITRLPIIESAFNVGALSSAKAAGIWQFIPETGRRYLKIDSVADERLDPILATYAAAQHLMNEYRLLGSWPLAINAYNTGPGRMMKAQKQLGTSDISVIIKNFKEPGYQFYSRNYYPEFLAALHVYNNQSEYFGGPVEKMPAIQYDLYTPESPVNLRDLALAAGADPAAIRRLNPALAPSVHEGQKPLPSGYLVRVPKDHAPRFAAAAESLNRQYARAKWHLVEEGQDMQGIAKIYGIPVEELQKQNNTLPNTPLLPGTVVNLPREAGVALSPEQVRDDI